ncbi:MAG: AgmX/PglI C-terminal domain-containing protein [Candidatus Lernaella stagnicola]|nr:AgmX/PglI C-terminal domain-containing protein [Candidatus Lernaella stagnicola]
MPTSTLHRVLKVGLIQDGKLIEDTILSEKQGLTIGLDPNNVFSIAETAVPKRHQLIEFSQGGYKINLLPEMRGRLLVDDKMLDIAELIQTGTLTKTNKGFEILLSQVSKGKITIGGSTVLFQLVPPPPPPPMVKLPKELRGSFVRNIDLFFLVVLFISAVAHMGMIAYLENVDYDDEEAMKVATDRFIQIVSEEDIIIPEEEDALTDEDIKPKPGGGGGGGGGGDQKGVEEKGIIAVITRMSDQSGAVADLLSESGLGSGLTDALNGIGGVRVGRVGDAGIGTGTRGTGTGGPGSGSGVGIGDIGSVGRGGTTGTGQRSERRVRARLSTSGGGVSGKIDAAKVRSYIRGRLGGVRHCYEMQLRVNPTLSGKVKVMFTIGSTGSVASCNVASNTMGNSLVASCVCRRVQRWRFPQPEEGSVTVSYTFIFTPAE